MANTSREVSSRCARCVTLGKASRVGCNSGSTPKATIVGDFLSANAGILP
jgi:hypothetical protein